MIFISVLYESHLHYYFYKSDITYLIIHLTNIIKRNLLITNRIVNYIMSASVEAISVPLMKLLTMKLSNTGFSTACYELLFLENQECKTYPFDEL